MRPRYQAIYLSPHLDDAVLSCGGQISARTGRGETVLIATLCAGEPAPGISPLAQSLHREWNLGESIASRRAEDASACQRLGADWWHGDVRDCIYRVHADRAQPFYSSLAEVYGAIHPADHALATFCDLLKALPAADEVIVPLGVGSHVDHKLVRCAAEQVFGKGHAYYEDFPYASRIFAVDRKVWPRWNWRADLIALEEAQVRARIEASAMYASQVQMMVGGCDRLEQKIRAYTRKVGGERVWRRVR